MYHLKSTIVENASKDDLGIRTALRARKIFCLMLGFKGETSSTSYLDLLGAISKKKRLDLRGIGGDENQRKWLRALEFLKVSNASGGGKMRSYKTIEMTPSINEESVSDDMSNF